MRIHRTDFPDGHFTLEAFTDDNRVIVQPDGTATRTDSRYCRDAEGALLKLARKAGHGPINYSTRGIA